jgi:hypothetical protein
MAAWLVNLPWIGTPIFLLILAVTIGEAIRRYRRRE